MNDDLAQKAISSALSGNWQKAIEINKKLLQIDSEDVDALTRLARAYAEAENIKKAKETTTRALKIDPLNIIAQKQSLKWKELKGIHGSQAGPAKPQSFLEEPGKTKIVSLINLGDPKTITQLDCGDEVQIVCHIHRVSVKTQLGKYIGRLSDDLAARLRNLIRQGNTYQALVKSVESKEVKIFIRETSRAKKLKDVPSFSPERINYVAFTPPELVHNKEEVEEYINSSSPEG